MLADESVPAAEGGGDGRITMLPAKGCRRDDEGLGGEGGWVGKGGGGGVGSHEHRKRRGSWTRGEERLKAKGEREREKRK